jgi:hypothetical protein
MPIGARYVTLHITIGEEKSKCASLAQENDFAPAYLLNLLRLVVKGTTKLREECNKYDLFAAPWCLLAKHNDWSQWFAISSCHLFAVPVSVYG